MLQPIELVGGVYNAIFLCISHGLCFAGVHRQHAWHALLVWGQTNMR